MPGQLLPLEGELRAGRLGLAERAGVVAEGAQVAGEVGGKAVDGVEGAGATETDVLEQVVVVGVVGEGETGVGAEAEAGAGGGGPAGDVGGALPGDAAQPVRAPGAG